MNIHEGKHRVVRFEKAIVVLSIKINTFQHACHRKHPHGTGVRLGPKLGQISHIFKTAVSVHFA